MHHSAVTGSDELVDELTDQPLLNLARQSLAELFVRWFIVTIEKLRARAAEV